MRIINIFIVLFILNMLCLTATASTNLINIVDVNKCYGSIKLKVVGAEDIVKGEYKINGCEEIKDNIWNCSCDNLSNMFLETKENVSNFYDITAEYYIEPISESNNTNITPNKIDIQNDLKKRKQNIDIEVNLKEEPKEEFKMPIFTDGMTIGLIIGGIVLLVFLMVGGVVYWLFKSELEDEKPKKKENKKIKNDISDEEILRKLRNNTK